MGWADLNHEDIASLVLWGQISRPIFDSTDSSLAHGPAVRHIETLTPFTSRTARRCEESENGLGQI